MQLLPDSPYFVMKLKTGDTVEATATIRRRDGKSVILPGETATVTYASEASEGVQIVGISLKKGKGPPMSGIVVTQEGPLRLA